MLEYQEEKLSSNTDFEGVENSDIRELIRKAVLNLPDKYKEVVLCIYFQEMTIAEAAYALKLAQGTVKSRLSRARLKLKKILEGRI